MSSTPLTPGQRPKKENRREYARQRIDQLTYAAFGPGNGGILLNLSEGGLSFQGIGSVHKDQLISLSFKLPGLSSPIEGSGEVVWSNDSGKGGGLRFVGLSEGARTRVRQWLAGEEPSAANVSEQVTSDSGATCAPTTVNNAADSDLIQSRYALAQKIGHLETPPIVPEAPANEAPQIPEPAPETSPADVSPADVAPVSMAPVSVAPAARVVPVRVVPVSAVSIAPASTAPASVAPASIAPAGIPTFMLTDYPEPEVRTSPSPQFVVFATGLLAGCVGVLAAIAGVRMLIGPVIPPMPDVTQSPAALHDTDSGGQNSPIDGFAFDDKHLVTTDSSVEAAPVARENFVRKTPSRNIEAALPPANPGLSARLAQVFQHSAQQKTEADQPSVAPLALSMPSPQPKAVLREPSAGDAPPAALVSAEISRSVSPSMSDQPKPPKLEAEKVDRTAGFLDAVLIQHNPPIYPPVAMKKRIEGLVTVNATIGTDGVPRALQLVSGNPSLAQAAQEAISHWRYVPAVSAGVPVESEVAITINFQFKP